MQIHDELRPLIRAVCGGMLAAIAAPVALPGTVNAQATPAPAQDTEAVRDAPLDLEDELTCRADIFPSAVTAPSEVPTGNARRRRLAGRLTLRARTSEDLELVSSVRIPASSGIRISLSEANARDPARPPTDPTDRRSSEDTRVILFDVDVSEAEAGLHSVIFRGTSGKECVGTLRIRRIGDG